MVEVGEEAPDFVLVNQDDKDTRLSDFRGKNIVVAFYPFDFSPVCTVEFGCFQDDLSELQNLNAVVLGISVDSKYCHKQFADKLGLDFPLLSDFGKEASRLYGTLRKEGFSDRAYFIIDRQGIIRFKKIMPVPKDRIENSEIIGQLKMLE